DRESWQGLVMRHGRPARCCPRGCRRNGPCCVPSGRTDGRPPAARVACAAVIVDLHSDLLLDVEARRAHGERDVFRRLHLPELHQAGIQVQVLALWVETAFVPEGAQRRALRMIDAAYREEQESEGALRIVRSRDELREALDAGAVAGILSLEGAE